jgi:hypothetical protein
MFRHASDLTRNPERRALLSTYQDQQVRLRRVATKIAKTSKSDVAKRLVAAEQEIIRLRSQRELLVVAVRAIIHAVGEQGGMRAWRNFFPAYSAAFEGLVALGAAPAADVLPGPDSRRSNGPDRPSRDSSPPEGS